MVAEVYDPARSLSEDWRTFFVDNKDRDFLIHCIEGPVVMSGARCLLNIMLCQPLIKRHRPISMEKHLLLEGIYDKSSHAKVMTRIRRSLEEAGYTRSSLEHDIIMTVNDALNMCYTHLGAYVRTMDIFQIADTLLEPEVEKICTMDYGDLNDKNINRMETVFKEQCEVVDTLLSGDSLAKNIFRAPLVCGALKRGQFHQFVLSAGPRTDTDEHVFLKPVVGSFLSGMRDIHDLAFESRSASKATHYNITQMSTTQYNNRKIHIQNSVMWHFYEGDCGSNVYLTYEPNQKTVGHFIGKFFVGPDGALHELTEDKFEMVINKEIKFRDVPGCRYVDGYCETCGGTISRSFSREGNIGFLSNVNTGAPIAQQVLSTKHLISTDAQEYDVHPDLENELMAIANKIFLRPYVRERKKIIALGFQPNDISKINDLKYYTSTNEIHSAYFSDIKYMTMGLVKEDGIIKRASKRIPMGGATKTYPHLSPEVLRVIQENPGDVIIQNGVAWLLLRNIDVDAPIMESTVISKSVKWFVNQFSSLVTKDVERYHSINLFMRDLTKLVWQLVNSHITHLSCLARACMITSRKDFNIPLVTNPDEVMFGSLGKIIPMRSIGGLFAFERYNLASNKAVTYITPKRTGILDEYMGFQDLIERDMEYPVKTGSPIEYDFETE